MGNELDDAKRAYDAAKLLQKFHGLCNPHKDAASLLLTNATTAYESALLADAQAKLDAMRVVIGETVVVADGMDPFVIQKLEANIHFGRAVAVSEGNAGWAWADETRPYVAPVVKEMVLYRKVDGRFTNWSWIHDDMRLTLSGITTADLDGMTGPITGTYIVEKL